ncbi:MAG: beta-lactamase family protein, partial [Brachybacterium sp.]|nr:beta-lactamase family protein [Brachybacterium sp.]
ALAVPPPTRPDTQRVYSDLGMIVLGRVLEVVSRQPLPELIRTLVLEPVGASDVTAGTPAPDRPTLTGGAGDRIEQQMVATGIPYDTGVDGSGFSWRTAPVRREIGDGNAHHACGGTAGHAGWFAGVDGLLAVASALADPTVLGVDDRLTSALGDQIDDGQGLGVRRYRIPWCGERRTFLGHPGFTGAFVAAAPATANAPAVRIALLDNRLHGASPEGSRPLLDVEHLGSTVMSRLDTALSLEGGLR